ncbi:MAG TPA: nucleotidyltransferase family protein, partial [Bacteroidales bacterium]|nr:nucleotidyltransferase family protein [Bacteroidales bacterium]
MKIIIPMAGIGKRMRPHTLSVPKPLISLAGKSIVQRLVESISLSLPARPEEIAFIVGDFGEAVEKQLLDIAQQAGATGRIYYQEEALGTAHAIHCAAPSLEGPVVVAFADTLFKADFLLRDEEDAVIWTSHVEDPSAFGVVVTGPEGRISAFVEKPREFISDQAIIGIYYFRD